MKSRPVAPRATRSALMAAAVPRISGPHEPRKSTYERPSTSVRRAPSARATKKGAPPTPRKARTGLLTPPGIRRCAAAKRASESGTGRSGLREVGGDEIAGGGIPDEGGRVRDAACEHRDHHVHRVRISGLAVDEGVLPIGRREVRAGI